MPTLLVLIGPTGVGKTELSLQLAEHLACPIVSADSRQIYREIPVGTAAPTPDEQRRVQHYLVGSRSVTDDYNAGQYERDVLTLLDTLFQTHPVVILTGGSTLYIDAVCRGFDDIPEVPSELREHVQQQYRERGLEWLQHEVERLDPDYWQQVDQHNPSRLIHCLEICLHTRGTYSSLRRRQVHERPFRIVKVALQRPREELYERIDRRVLQMMQDGLLDEARRVYPHRQLNALQTVGYRELFAYLDGEYDLNRAIELIQRNSRRYAKRQLTWFRADKTIHWLDATNDYETNIHTIASLLHDDSVQAKDC